MEAWAKTECFLEEVTEGVPLEDILTYDKLPQRNLKKKNQKVEKHKNDEKTKEQVRQKWAKWRKENL